MKYIKVLLCLCFLLAAAGCMHAPGSDPSSGAPAAKSSSLQRFEFAEFHMGSMFRIVFYAPDEPAANAAAEAVFYRIKMLDDTMSDYNPESELMRLCRQKSGMPVKVSEVLFDVLQKSQAVAKATDGAFDATVGPMIQLWRVARKTKILPSPDAIARAKESSGFQKMILDRTHRTVTLSAPNMRLDLGGIAKGYAASQALKVLAEKGITSAMAAASGDIALGAPPPGKKGWEIGIASIDHPDKGTTSSALLSHAGISTSGDTEQHIDIGGRRYSHIVDPKTGFGLEERIGVTIIAPDATTSDAYATAISVMGVEKGLKTLNKMSGVGALIVVLDGSGKKVIESNRFRRLAGERDSAK